MASARTPIPESITIRAAAAADQGALERLAQLDSAALPRGPALVAEAGSELRAAIALDTGAVIADPFRPTRELVRLLVARAEQLEGWGEPEIGPICTSAAAKRSRTLIGPSSISTCANRPGAGTVET